MNWLLRSVVSIAATVLFTPVLLLIGVVAIIFLVAVLIGVGIGGVWGWIKHSLSEKTV